MKSRISVIACALSAAGVFLCGAGALAQPTNDDCAAGSLPVIPGTPGSFSGDATGATRDGAACAGAGGEDVWYTFTPNASANWTFSMCITSPDWDSVLSIHPACPTGPTDNNSIACNDDFCGGFSNSQFTTALTAGTMYFVRVAGFAIGDVAPFTIVITNDIAPVACCTAGSCTITQGFNCVAPSTINGAVCSPNPCPIPPPNDECGPSNPALTVDTPVSGTTLLSTTSFTITPDVVCGPAAGAGGGSDIFFRFTPNATGPYSFSLCGSTYDTVLSVHGACPADSNNVIACNDDSTATIPCDGAAFSLQSFIPAIVLSAGQTYAVRVAGFNAVAGSFTLTVTSGGPTLGACCAEDGGCTGVVQTSCPSGMWTDGAVCTPNPCPQPPAPSNDECANAITIVVGAPAIAGSAYGSTQSTIATCTGSTRDVWYTFTAASSGPRRATVVPNFANGFSVAVLEGGCFGTQVACAPAPGDGVTSQVTFSVTAGTQYAIRVAGFPPILMADGGFDIAVSIPVLPGNDECTGTLPALSVGVPVNSDNIDATTTFVPTPTSCGAFALSGGGKDLFYSFTPTTSSAFRIDTCNSAFDTVLAVFTACPVGDFNLIACNDDADATVVCSNSVLNSVIENLNLTSGTTYIVRVAGFGDAVGNPAAGAFQLLVTEQGTPTTGACCVAGGTCSITDAAGCSGSYQGVGTLCLPNPCPQPNTGACCAAGSCFVTSAAGCGGTYQGDNTSCSPNPCPQVTGACCTSGSCAQATLSACVGAGGTYQGNGTSCLPNPCPQPSGVCCRGATCATAASAGACTGTFSQFRAGTCNAAGNVLTPCCHADYNKAAGITVQDVFDFLTDWFNGETRANLANNGNGTPTVQSVFDFLTAWFNGGCS